MRRKVACAACAAVQLCLLHRFPPEPERLLWRCSSGCLLGYRAAAACPQLQLLLLLICLLLLLLLRRLCTCWSCCDVPALLLLLLAADEALNVVDPHLDWWRGLGRRAACPDAACHLAVLLPVPAQQLLLRLDLQRMWVHVSECAQAHDMLTVTLPATSTYHTLEQDALVSSRLEQYTAASSTCHHASKLHTQPPPARPPPPPPHTTCACRLFSTTSPPPHLTPQSRPTQRSTPEQPQAPTCASSLSSSSICQLRRSSLSPPTTSGPPTCSSC